jgi:hypothetical protein
MRRISQRLREHDWLAAGIELVIVVAGILIALQVSNWNQDRQDARRGHGYLQRLRSDIASDRKANDNWRRFNQQVVAYGRQALAYGDAGTLVDGSAWKTVLAYYQASQWSPHSREASTFNTMLYSGDLRLIGDPTLRDQLSFYYASSSTNDSDGNVFNELPAYRQRVRGLTPYSVQQYIWVKCYRVSDRDDAQELADCASPITEQEAAAILKGYGEDKMLLPELRYWLANRQVAFMIDVNRGRQARELEARVAAALQR